MNADRLREELCRAFCADLSVRPVPAGLAISGTFEDASGDPIRCFLEERDGHWRLVDDGQFLADLEGHGVDVERGGRADYLHRVLATAGAAIDPDGLQIATPARAGVPVGADVIRFLTALVRARDVAFWSKERVRSTFKEDATAALTRLLGERADLTVDAAVPGFEEFPADLLVRPRAPVGTITAVFLAQSIDTLNEAVMLRQETWVKRRPDIRVAAVVEDRVNLNHAKAKRALNRLDALVAYSPGDQDAALHQVERVALAEPARAIH